MAWFKALMDRSEQEQQNSFDSSRFEGNLNLNPGRNRIRTDNATSEREPRMNDDDDIVNQNSSHDGRSRMEIDLTHSTLINEHAGSPLVGAESALMLQEETKKSK